MRLQKYIADSGVASRRAAEKMIEEGRVKVNGETISQMGYIVQPEDEVLVDDAPIAPIEEKHYIMYNKPMGEITSVSDEEGRPTVLDKFRDYPVRLYPVGRLDYNSEGLLLLTNDGELTNSMLHPSRLVDKVYMARVSNVLTDQEAMKLERGVYLGGYKTAPAKVRILKTSEIFTDITLTIHEGKYRQVRRMLESIGHQVILLKRVRFGPLELGDLPRGMWRRLKPNEINKLKRYLGTH
ncbi:MAG: pseudouridine synthase [Eubacteriales bacterium]|nr:pseudouridine synthase [Prevotellaceae bacterium]MDY6073055.1 pseudouridine synthase [Eubacteriales bacterium]